MSAEQLALDLGIPVRGAARARTYNDVPARPQLYLVPLGDRRAALRLDPYGEHGLEQGDAEVVVRGWGRPVADVHVAGARL